jgi:regulator of protease activity HflC (stomatin/prohibitin superfamily)
MAFEDLVVTLLVDEVVGGFFINVPPGHIACIYDLGRGVLPKILKPGLHPKIPFWQTAKLFNAQTLEYTISDEHDPKKTEALGDQPINVVATDGKHLQIKGSLLFRLTKSEAPKLWENVGDNFIQKVVRPFTRNQVSAIFSQVSFDQISTYRDQIQKKIQDELTHHFAAKGLEVEKFLLSEIKTVKPKSKPKKEKKDKED